jgi:hypothetical protein
MFAWKAPRAVNVLFVPIAILSVTQFAQLDAKAFAEWQDAQSGNVIPE